MGFPDTFEIAVNDRAIRKQAGNSVVIPMIQAVAKEMIKSISVQKNRNEKSYFANKEPNSNTFYRKICSIKKHWIG
jgi:hypothetical protein